MKRLLGSYFFTTTCSLVISFIIPLIIYSITHSALWTALIYAAETLPYLVVTPFAGVWSDRYSKRQFLIWGDVANMVLSVAIYAAAGHLSGPWAAACLVFFSFAAASTSAIHHPMFQSIAPEILDVDTLARFNALVNAFDNLISIIVPALVAALMVYLHEETIVLLCALGFMLSLPLLWGVRSEAVERGSSGSVIAELAEGIRYVLKDKNLVSFSVLFACVNFGLAIIGANLVFIFTSAYAVPQDQIGYYYTVIGIGAAVGSLGAPLLMKVMGDANLIIGLCFGAGLISVLAAAARSPLLFAIEWSGATACLSAVIVTFFTFRQRVVPPTLLGRTVGVTRFISYAAIPPASILGGIVMERLHSESVVMVIGGAVIIAGSALAMHSPAFSLPRLKESSS